MRVEIGEMPLQRAGVAAAPVTNSTDLLNDLHLKERDYFVESDYPQAPGKWLGGLRWEMSDTPR